MKEIFLVITGFISIACSGQTRYADSLTNLLKDERVPIKRFNLFNEILEDEVKSGTNIDTSMCIQLLSLSHDLRNDSLTAIAYNMAGSYNARNGDYTTALEYLFKAVPLAEKAKDKRRISSLYFDISLTYIILNNMKEALYYNYKGAEKLPDKSSLQYDFMSAQFDRNMVRYYLQLHKPEEALPYLRHLEQVGIKLKTPVIRLPSLFLSGAAYEQLANQEAASNYFSKAATLADSISSLGLKWTNDKYYIPYLIREGNYNVAKKRALVLLKLGEVHNNWDVKLTAADFLRTVFSKTRQVDSAYYYLQAEMSMKDSFLVQNNNDKAQVLAFNEKLRNMEELRRNEIRAKQQEQSRVWAMVGLGISILVILFIYQLRKRRREMHRKLAGQREQISRDLHDNVGAQLTYIKGNIDWLIDGKGGLSHEEEMKKLEVVSDTSTNIMNDLRETIWVIKKEHIKLDELADRLKSYLQKQISFCPGIDIEIMEDIRKNYNFPPTESLNTYRICQEAIANIIRHAGATRIVMLIKAGKQWDYFFSISDNGEGFALQKDYDGHYGLLNMEERAKEIGAQLSIDSEPGKGTKVTLVKFS
jgi:signal transduction histidine kinase